MNAPAMNPADERAAVLLTWARARLREELGAAAADRPREPWCSDLAATFVTLRWGREGRLQGCIGSIEPRRSIVDDVERNVIAAALEDPRALPLELARVADLDIELSILGRLEPLSFHDEASALAAIGPGWGVVLSLLGRRATFLPVMWERMPDPREFLAELKAKAGLGMDFWDPRIKLWRYAVEHHVDRADA